MIGIGPKAPAGTRLRLTEVNGEFAVVTLLGDRPTYVATFEVVEGRIQTIHAVGNPDKLAYFARQFRERPIKV